MADVRTKLGPLPARLQHLPVDARGYPVPWFVGWIERDGVQVPEFRAMDPKKWVLAIKTRVCWVCGAPLGRWLAFPIGPMCALTRTTSEPPSHRECAEWAIQHCPFLANPHAVRRTEDLPPNAKPAAGAGLDRNPGVTCLWMTRSYSVFSAYAGEAGHLITVGTPEVVTWWREGRAATRAEVEASIDSGYPTLLSVARAEGPQAVRALEHCAAAVRAFLPAGEPAAVDQ
jgi:hypothetical protein